MKKVIFILILFTFFTFQIKADGSFLESLRFHYLYEDQYPFDKMREEGISPEEFADYLLSYHKTIGEKAALVCMLSNYCEYHINTENKEEESYRKKYFSSKTNYFREIVQEKYHGINIPLEIEFLLLLMQEFESYNPNVSAFTSIADKLSNSLTVQSTKVITMAYDIVYNDRRDFDTRKKFRNDYLRLYQAKWESYHQDIHKEVYDDVMSWTEFVDDCDNKTNGEELACYCEINNEQDLIECLNETNREMITRIQNATIKADLKDSNTPENLKKSILKSIELEQNFISTLNTSQLNKAAALYFYLNQLDIFCLDFDSYYMIIHPYAFNRDTKYMRRFVWQIGLQECAEFNLETKISLRRDFFESKCFTLYMKEMEKDLQEKYKQLGGNGNDKLKKAQAEWNNMKSLYKKREQNNAEALGIENDIMIRDILANRVSMLHFYLNPEELKEIYSKIANKIE